MKRLARVSRTGSVVAIITGDEQSNCVQKDGKLQLPVLFFGEPEFVDVTIQNGVYFENNVGFKFNDLEDWQLI